MRGQVRERSEGVWARMFWVKIRELILLPVLGASDARSTLGTRTHLRPKGSGSTLSPAPYQSLRPSPGRGLQSFPIASSSPRASRTSDSRRPVRAVTTTATAVSGSRRRTKNRKSDSSRYDLKNDHQNRRRRRR